MAFLWCADEKKSYELSRSVSCNWKPSWIFIHRWWAWNRCLNFFILVYKEQSECCFMLIWSLGCARVIVKFWLRVLQLCKILIVSLSLLLTSMHFRQNFPSVLELVFAGRRSWCSFFCYLSNFLVDVLAANPKWQSGFTFFLFIAVARAYLTQCSS